MLQRRWIDLVLWGVDEWFKDDPLVVVAGDVFWYPVEGHPSIRCAPDVLVVFGRPKRVVGSWLQWQEDDVAPQVVFEVLSPSNTPAEMARRRLDYERFGVEEYYEIEPELPASRGWVRRGGRLVPIPVMNGWTSPRLGITFIDTPGVLRLVRPDGEAFADVDERYRRGRQAALDRDAERQRAEAERQRAEAERQRAEEQHQRAEAERQRAEEQHQRAEAAERERERLAELLRRLGVDPDVAPPG
jgi:Uma2 family endonuclease